jgi:hypothetical protein
MMRCTLVTNRILSAISSPHRKLAGQARSFLGI